MTVVEQIGVFTETVNGFEQLSRKAAIVLQSVIVDCGVSAGGEYRWCDEVNSRPLYQCTTKNTNSKKFDGDCLVTEIVKFRKK